MAEAGVEVDPVGQVLVVGGHGPALAGGQQLAVVGGEAPGPVHGTGVPAADPGAVGLAHASSTTGMPAEARTAAAAVLSAG